ncbi:hypothetical protein QCE73_12415 [Caballeronia sp. LZ029]|uniref:hypothetical protein n=1 Tax=Caballeronia sp. LZ029 TaxID=3038564 RepID=UPI00285D8BC7|nr:hypothetical protein [Caballeronia sp. LZ029]MDR5743955.1 hypothetical protein [Caballeronia sp. LZ029]
MQTRLQAIIDEARPRRAMFTTFTFSANWFESFCLPLLRVSGCHKVDLLVDSREACKSTDETSSLYAGTYYRVIPVRQASGGFFHPKIAYLERGSGDDVLVVGSGNLTTRGQNSNLEVLDSVNALEHPMVFEAFAAFAEVFAQTSGLSAKASASLTYYARRAREVAAAAPAVARQSPTAWLIHTLNAPAGNQFAKLVLEQLPAAATLTVYGPYLDPKGEAVCKLAGLCGVPEISLGAQLVDKGYVIRVDSIHNLPPETRFVVPVLPEPKDLNRFPHAKIFDVRAPSGCMVMTGSVNATLQSLFGLENVELSLVRKFEKPPFDWKALEGDDLANTNFEACVFKSPELGHAAPALDAQWHSDGTIMGTVSPCPEDHLATLEVWRDDELECGPIEGVLIQEDGSFVAPVQTLADEEGARRLRLQAGDFTVTGWLNIEVELDANPVEKALSRAGRRIRQGARPDDRDLLPILNWMASVLHRKPEPKTKPGDETKTGSKKGEATKLQPSEQKRIEPRAANEWSARDEPELGVPPLTAEQAMAAAFKKLTTRILSNSALAGGPRSKLVIVDSQKKESGKDKPGEPEEQKAWDAMLEKLPKTLEKDATAPIVSAVVAQAAAEVLEDYVDMMAAGGASVPDQSAEEPAYVATDPYGLRDWLEQYTAYAYDDDNRERLLSVFCTFACCALDVSSRLATGALKEMMQSFALRELTLDDWHTAIAKATRKDDPFEFVPEQARGRLRAHAAKIVAGLTMQEELEQMVGSIFGGAPTVSPPNPRYQRILACLLELKAKPPPKGKIFGLIPQQLQTSKKPGCPHCNGESIQGASEVRALETHRATIHSTCGKPVFAGIRHAKLQGFKVSRDLYIDWNK